MSEFSLFFEQPYNTIANAIVKYVAPGSFVVDLGCNDGTLIDMLERQTPCTVYGVDINSNALAKLRAKDYTRVQVESVRRDANEFLRSTPLIGIDAVLINATLHEINTPGDQEAYLDTFLSEIRRMLRPSGVLLVGDYYYPPELSDEDVNAFSTYQQRAIGHADVREKFVQPHLLEASARANGFGVLEKQEIRAVREIDRRYYLFAFRKQ